MDAAAVVADAAGMAETVAAVVDAAAVMAVAAAVVGVVVATIAHRAGNQRFSRLFGVQQVPLHSIQAQSVLFQEGRARAVLIYSHPALVLHARERAKGGKANLCGWRSRR